MNPLETHIRKLYEIRSTGAATPETAYYLALSNLLNEVGKTLKPRVVTNYRDFVLVGQDASGQAVKLEIYRLADNEADFGAGALGAPYAVLECVLSGLPPGLKIGLKILEGPFAGGAIFKPGWSLGQKPFG